MPQAPAKSSESVPELAPIQHARDPQSEANPARWVWASLALALFGTAWLVDPFADAAFDAPKRFALMLGSAGLGAALILGGLQPGRFAQSGPARHLSIGALLVLGLCGLSVLANPLDAPSWRAGAALLTVFLFAACLPETSPNISRLWRWAAWAVFANVGLSLAQHAGLELPWSVAYQGGRFDTGALLGNEGLVSMACALAGSACWAMALSSGAKRLRLMATTGLILCMAAIALNRQITSAAALIVSALIVTIIRFRPRRLLLGGLIGLTIIAAIGLGLLARDRVGADPSDTAPTSGETAVIETSLIDRIEVLSTYRVGAHAAALEMALTRPLVGFGAGSYSRLAQDYRLRAEVRWRTRFDMPPTGNAHVFAHQDLLQFAAEFGLPAAVAMAAWVILLLCQMIRLAWRRPATESLALTGILIAGATLSLAWFPMHTAFIACLLTLVAGRSWRVLHDHHAVHAGKPTS